MFDALSERLQQTLGEVRQRGTLTEDDVNAAMREIRLALLEADVNFKVVLEFPKQLKEQNGSSVAVAACDVYRPAAVEQLIKVGGQAGAEVYEQGTGRDPVDIAEWALGRARSEERDVLIVDTSGRLHVDEALMAELAKIKKRTKPHNVLLVVDSMTGQDAVNVAESFAETAAFDGVVLTKVDGDARGGAALSVKAVTCKPILYASTGEKLDAFERFHPDRMAQRILGMGDVMTLVEKAEAQIDEDRAAELERKLRNQQFTLEDFLEQMQQVRKMGPLSGLLKMIPGLNSAQMSGMKVDDRELDRLGAIITSMTREERRNPGILNGSRRRRIARGSGTSVQAVNQLVKQFSQMQKVMRQVSQGRMPSLSQLVGGR